MENKIETNFNSLEKVQLICKYLSSKKAKGIVYIAVEHKTSLCDYFVVAGGSSKTQVKSLGENLEELLEKQHGLIPRRREGIREGRWAVLDYGDVIVHIFGDEERDFYNLERLWEDGENLVRCED
ncbi:MAG: ribosome silencing factor [Clostridia bacterium]|nr:ribosome silencing factor [Clostridia bacterium]